MRLLLVIAASFALAACASTGPSSSNMFPYLVSSALPVEHITVYGPGAWTPNRRNLDPSWSSGPPEFKSGVTAITDNGLFFLEWDRRARAYVVTKRIRRDEMESVSIVRNGWSCFLLVQESRDLTFHLFEFSNAANMLNDCATAQRAAEALN